MKAPGTFFYSGSSAAGEPNVLRVIGTDERGYTWVFVDPETGGKRLPSDCVHFTWHDDDQATRPWDGRPIPTVDYGPMDDLLLVWRPTRVPNTPPGYDQPGHIFPPVN